MMTKRTLTHSLETSLSRFTQEKMDTLKWAHIYKGNLINRQQTMLRKSPLVNSTEFKEEILPNVLNTFPEARSRGESSSYALSSTITLVAEPDKGLTQI